MDFDTWLSNKKGRLTKLAADFGVSKGSVSLWRNRGVPKKHLVAIRDYTKREVSLEGMLPKDLRQAWGKKN